MEPIEVSASQITYHLVEGTPILAEVQRLRFCVWKAEGVKLHDETSGTIADPHDDHALHWAVFDGDCLVGAARLCIHDRRADVPDAHLLSGLRLPEPVASMNRLVVLRSHRGLGIGMSLDRQRVEKATQMGARSIAVTAVDYDRRCSQLIRLGFAFEESASGYALWSPTVQVRAASLFLRD